MYHHSSVDQKRYAETLSVDNLAVASLHLRLSAVPCGYFLGFYRSATGGLVKVLGTLGNTVTLDRGMTKRHKTGELIEGSVHRKVMLETCRDTDVTRPRVRPVSHFPADTRVWFPRELRTDFPIGTRFLATVKVSQKRIQRDGKLKGSPYLSASNIGVIVDSIPDPGLRAKIKPGTKSGRAFHYIWE